MLNESWYFDEDRKEQFTSIWWKRNTDHGHFKKIINYNIFGLKTEINYYKNPNYPEKFNGTIYAWSVFDFNSKKMTYLMDNPEYGIPFEPKQEKTIEISQKEFDAYRLK